MAAPQEVQNGTAVLYGITNSGTAISFPGYATFILQTAGAGHQFKLTPVTDTSEFDASLIAANGHVEVDITWTPSGATRTAAQATAAFLTPLSSVALANFSVSAFNGTWIYVGGGKIDLSQVVGKMQIRLRKYDNTTQNASLVTTVSG